MRSAIVSLNGHKLHYYEIGGKTDPPLVLVHGFHACAQSMLEFAKTLAPSFHVFIPDLPGFGKSEEQKIPFSIINSAEILHQFVQKIGLSKYYLAGFSMGGGITMEMLLKDHSSCLGLILIYPLCCGSHIKYSSHKRLAVSSLLFSARMPLLKNLMKRLFYSDKAMYFIFKKLSVSGKSTREDLLRRIENSRQCRFKTYIEGVSSILNYFPSGFKEFPHLKTVIILNHNDELIDPDLTFNSYKPYFPAMKVCCLNLGSHNPYRCTNQEQFNREFPHLLQEVLKGLEL